MRILDQLTLNWIFFVSTVILVTLSVSVTVFFVSKRRREFLDARRATLTSFAPAVSFFPAITQKAASSVSLELGDDSPPSVNANLDVKNLEKSSGLEHAI